jgi:predicted Zn-dependent protease
MFNKELALEILNKALILTEVDMSEAVLETQRLSLTRFAESRITDNIDNEETILYLRLVKDKKMGIIASGDLSNEGIKKAVTDCQSIMKFVPPDERFTSFPSNIETQLRENMILDSTTDFGPENRAKGIEQINRIIRKGRAKSSGAFRLEESRLAVLNSLGVERYWEGNHGQLSLTVSDEMDNSGWAMQFNPDASKIDVNTMAQTALKKAATSRDQITLEDGQYTVILEPAAVGQLLLMLSFMGFGCKTFYQRRSFMSGKIGEKIAGDNFTVSEDPLDPDFNYCPFDYEGIPRAKVELITNGIAKGVVYNSYYANLMDTGSTGNALQPTNSYGPYPKTLSVAHGNNTIDEMIKSTERGVYITHFWYINFLNPMRTMVTGTTLDGTFLIENGRISKPVKNMRTNQSLLEAFSNIEMITKERIVYPQFSVLMKVPGMKINNFNLNVEEEDESKC